MTAPLDDIKGLDSGMLPPCQDVLYQKIMRCNYVAYMWKHATEKDPLQNIDPAAHEDGTYLPIWFSGQQLPQDLSDTMDYSDTVDPSNLNEDNDESDQESSDSDEDEADGNE